MTTPAGQNTVNFLCKLWKEDGVWNGMVEDLPIAVFGETFEDAKINLLDALICHLESALELGNFEDVIAPLKQREHDFLAIDEIPVGAPLLKMQVAREGQHVLPLTP